MVRIPEHVPSVLRRSLEVRFRAMCIGVRDESFLVVFGRVPDAKRVF